MKGRQVPKLDELTLPDSGITIQYHKVSPLLRDDVDAALRRQYPIPDPPMQASDGGFGDGKPQPNPLDPEYREQVAMWQIAHYNRLGDKMLRMAIASYVVVDVDTEAVQALREQMAPMGVELDSDDKYVYVSRICISSDADRDALGAALFNRSSPTREEVESSKATF